MTDDLVYLYAHPRQETELRAMLGRLPQSRGYLSTLVPPGEMRAATHPVRDPQARPVWR